MKEKLLKKLGKKGITITTLSNIALMFSVIAARRNCMYIFHQPKMPDELKKFKRQ